MKKLMACVGILVLVSGCSDSEQVQICTLEPTISFKNENSLSSRYAAGATESANASGSGWEDLDGSIVNYEYEDFGGFRLSFCNKALHWRGYKGAFKDVAARVAPVVSKVADGIYFMSWPTPGDGGDNVVVNFIDMKVFGHLGVDSSFDLISGPVHCVNTPECEKPVGEPMHPLQVLGRLTLNAWKSGHLSPMAAMSAMRERGTLTPADEAGMAALTGKTFAFRTPEGSVRISIDGRETRSSIGDGEPLVSPTYATLVADGIYYVSWDGKPSGNHVVFNSHNMRVYDQILPDGTRAEAIYKATCFADDGC